MSPGNAAWLRAALTMLCPFQLSLCSPPKRCLVTICRNCFCRVTLCPFGEGWSTPLHELFLLSAGYLLPWCSCCGDSFDPCNQHRTSFWNANIIADRPAGYVSQQQREAFRTAASRKRIVHSPQDLRGERLGKAAGSLAPVGGTGEAQQLERALPGLWSSGARGSCWSPQGVSVMHNITSVGLPAWFNGLQLF